jgi:Fe-S oxidoreductase
MAKLKYAFQAEYYKTHRRQWRDYVFGYFHVAAKLAAAVAPLSNALMAVPPIKNLMANVLGITPHRPFPKFSTRRAKLSTTEIRSPGKKVILLSDTFARYIEPDTEQAALDILCALGCDVHVLPVLGAGASLLSKGFIYQARDHAARVLALLEQVDPQGQADILGVEPPEIYAFKHEYVDLLPGRIEEAERRAAHAWLVDEYLVRSDEFSSLRVASKGQFSRLEGSVTTNSVFFHPHCHQRAEGPAPDGLPSGTTATLELLRSCGYQVELMDTGCCGMAGTFGYEAEHHDLSMKIGELKLFPQIRALSRTGRQLQIASSGAACRLQIRQGTGLEAIHPIVLVAKQVREWRGSDRR